ALCECGSDVATNQQAAGAGGSPSSSTTVSISSTGTGIGGSAGGGGAPACAARCGGASAGAHADAPTAARGRAHIPSGPSESALDQLEACYASNLATLKGCGLSKVCDGATSAYQTCITQNSPTDAASSVSGAGGFVGGCSQPGCGSSADGTCTCDEN